MKEHQENAKRHERSADGCWPQLFFAEKAITKLERQQQSIRDQMLVP